MAIVGKVDKGILMGFMLLIVVVGLIGSLFLTQYIYGMVMGTLYYVAEDRNQTYSQINATFTADNTTAQSLGNANVIIGTIRIDNGTDQIGLNNFTINYPAGTILLPPTGDLSMNTTTMYTNYSYYTVTTTPINITSGARTFITNSEASYFTTLRQVNAGGQFAGSLLAVAIVLLVFGGFLTVGVALYRKRKKGGGNLGY